MFIVDKYMLHRGDIILTRNNGRLSRFIRLASKMDYSHAILYLGNGICIHSNKEGTHRDSVSKILYLNSDDVKILRMKGGVSQYQLDKIIEFANKYHGATYGAMETLGMIKSFGIGERFFQKENFSNQQFCSRFVAMAYQNAGIPLVENPEYCYPGEFTKSSHLNEVVGAVKMLSLDEAVKLSDRSLLEKNNRVLSALLADIRKLSRENIQSMNHVIEHVSLSLQYSNKLDKKIGKKIMATDYYRNWSRSKAVGMVDNNKTNRLIENNASLWSSLEEWYLHYIDVKSFNENIAKLKEGLPESSMTYKVLYKTYHTLIGENLYNARMISNYIIHRFGIFPFELVPMEWCVVAFYNTSEEPFNNDQDYKAVPETIVLTIPDRQIYQAKEFGDMLALSR